MTVRSTKTEVTLLCVLFTAKLQVISSGHSGWITGPVIVISSGSERAFSSLLDNIAGGLLIVPPLTKRFADTDWMGTEGFSAKNLHFGQLSGPSVTNTTPSGPKVGGGGVVQGVVEVCMVVGGAVLVVAGDEVEALVVVVRVIHGAGIH